MDFSKNVPMINHPDTPYVIQWRIEYSENRKIYPAHFTLESNSLFQKYTQFTLELNGLFQKYTYDKPSQHTLCYTLENRIFKK